MFMGEYSPSIDEKGRVAIPSRLRRSFGSGEFTGLVLTHGFDRCIMAFRNQDWEEFVRDTLMKLPQSDPLNRKRIRFLLGGASECELDRQGRILIPGYLKEYSGIRDEIIIVGLFNRIEFWARGAYEGQRPGPGDADLFAAGIGM